MILHAPARALVLGVFLATFSTVAPTTVPTMAPLCANADDATVTALTTGTAASLITSCSQITGAIASYCAQFLVLQQTCPVSCSVCNGSPTPTPVALPTKAPTAPPPPTAAPTFLPWIWSNGETAATLLESYNTALNAASPVRSIVTLAAGHESNGEPGIVVSWILDELRATVTFAIEAQTTGWIALGLAEAAGMKGADVVMGHVDGASGSVHIGDYHAIANAAPIRDGCQDWSVLHGEEDSAEKRTILITTRNLTTSDSNDRPILLDSIKRLKIITAMGAHGDDGGGSLPEPAYAYHGAHKMKTTVDLRFGGAVTLLSWTAATSADASMSFIDLRANEGTFTGGGGISQYPAPVANGYPIPSSTTTYTSFCFPTSAHSEWSAHGGKTIVSFSALPDPTGRSDGYIHHFVLYAIPEDGCEPGSGSDWPVVWAGGAGLFEELPSTVGIPFAAYKSFRLQVHYNNPTNLVGLLDNSGVRVWLTSVPRAHAAGVLQLGDPSLQLTGQKLPTGGSHYTYTCSAAQTNAWAVDEITVFSSILHMHKNGAQMYTEVTDPAGSVVKRTNSVEYFDFEHQDPTLLETFTIAKGSTLTTRCYFDNIVGPDLSFGLGSDQEMCIDFVYYYPVTPGLDKCSGASGVVSATIDFSADAGIRVFGTAAGTPADPTCTGGGVLTAQAPPTQAPTDASTPTAAPSLTPGQTKAPSEEGATSATVGPKGNQEKETWDPRLALGLGTFFGLLVLAVMLDLLIVVVVFTVVAKVKREPGPRRGSLAALDAVANPIAAVEMTALERSEQLPDNSPSLPVPAVPTGVISSRVIHPVSGRIFAL